MLPDSKGFGVKRLSRAALDQFLIACWPDSDLQRIPETEPVLIVANHPHGFLDGLALGSIIGRRRSDFRFLANAILSDLPEINPFVIPVDVFHGHAQANGISARSACR